MRSEFLLRHRVSFASVAVVFAAVIAVVAYALSVPGYATHRADINDGGVWVTKGDSGLFGRFNKPISQLDGYTYTENEAAAPDIDVLQEGSTVVAVDHSGGSLYPVDVTKAALTVSAKVPLGGDATVALNGGTVALADAAKGDVRAVAVERDAPVADLAGLAAPKPLAVAGPNAALAVSQDGTVFAAGNDKLVAVRRAGGEFGKPETSKIAAPTGADVAVTAVGDDAVVLVREQSSSTASLRLPDGTTATVPAATGAVLQQPGPSADRVLVATPGALLSFPLGGGKPATLATARGGAPAAPTLLGGCVFAAWAGSTGQYATTCGSGDAATSDIDEASTDLVFRVNRDKILLNDRKSGRIWNLDSGKPRKVDNWQVVKPRDNKKQSKDDNNTANARPQPPKPKPDTLGARPGRTTSLYVLDNDSDPSGGVLAVSSITPRGNSGRLLSISPDGQTVDLRLPAGSSQPVSFSYTINGAKGQPVAADVSVEIRNPSDNSPPTLRDGPKHAWTVPVGGTVTIPVLNDWRDYTDGDSIVLSSAKASGGTVSTTPDGQLIFTAPDKSGPQTIDYTVDDGHGATERGSVTVTVQGPDDTAVSPVASPDYARGQAGRPITIQPLANDLPGSDPNSPSATLRLAGNVASPAGAPVTTDLTTGTITVKPSKPGPLLLNYQAAYGYAAPAKGVIAVQVDPQGNAQPPVTATDIAVLHGQTPVIVDVLANDSDPAGNLLVVQRAAAADPDQVEVAVIDGRYVRLRSKNPAMSPTVQSVDYTVTDGVTGDATGSINVTQLPPSDAAPVTLDDYARVRSGQSVGVAVLDNDVSPSGSPLSLSKSVYGAPAGGQLIVRPASAGTAFVSGRIVRFVAAPARQLLNADISYVAEDVAGNTQEGQLHVTVVPPRSKTNLNQNPLPPPLEGRATAGQTIRIKVPSSGVDPDGDPVVVTGLGSAPKLGRVLGTSARGIEYQAYPFVGNGGTDTFSYVVTDIYGASSTGTVQVAVVTPGDPQPPVAVDDTVTTTPGARVQVDVLANDLVASGDRVTVEPLSKTDPQVGEGLVKLDSERGPITVTAGTAKTPVQFNYTISNGISEATAQVTVRALASANLPPLAFDKYPTVQPGADSVDVNLLDANYDPDGTGPLSVVSPAGATDGKVNLKLTGFPQVVPYVVADAKGARATAVVYLPAIGAGAPMLRPGKSITMKPGETQNVDITQYVVDPANKPVRTTVASLIETSPAQQLTRQDPKDATHISITAAKTYNGPAALNFQVTNGRTLNDGDKAFISIPVQIGDDRPVLRCPTSPVELTEGGKAVRLPVATYCHAWVPNRDDLDTLPFTGTWKSQPAGVTLNPATGTQLGLVADSGNARAGATGVLTVSARGASANVAVSVVEAKRLEVSPLTVDGVQAGKPRVIDLTSSLRSYLAKPTFSIVGTPQIAGAAGSVTTSGARLTLTPSKDAKGTLRIRYIATDVPQQNRLDHQAPGEITVHLIGHPDAPTNVQPGITVESKVVRLRWTAPAANGTPISNYVARYSGGQQSCGAAPSCTVTGLTNGRAYTFTVVAQNAIGDSPASAPSKPATPDAVPTAVQGFAFSDPQDGRVTLRWQTPRGDFSGVQKYKIVGGPKSEVTVTGNSYPLTGMTNSSVYGLRIAARNAKNYGPLSAELTVQSAGMPGTPAAPKLSPQDDTASNERVVGIEWDAVNANGPAGTQYLVRRVSDGGATKVACGWAIATSCTDTNVQLDGTTYTYSVSARTDPTKANPAQHTTQPGPGATTEAAATPDQVTGVQTNVTADTPDGVVPVSYRTGRSHGKTSLAQCVWSGGTCSEKTQVAENSTINAQFGFDAGKSGTFQIEYCNGSSGGAGAGAACSRSDPEAFASNGPPNQVQNLRCNLSGSTITVAWDAATKVGARTPQYRVRLDGMDDQNVQTGTSKDFPGQQQNGAGRTATVTTYDNKNEMVSTSVNGGDCKNPDPPPADPPTLSNLAVVVYTGQHIGVAYDATYPSGSEGRGGGMCHVTRDGAEAGDALPCAYNGRGSRQIYNQPTGSHTYCGYIQIADGRRSNTLCKTVTVI